MDICEQYKETRLSGNREYSCIYRDGRAVREEQEVLSEHVINIFINKEKKIKLVCSPQYLTEVVLGHLYTEGIVEGVCDIDRISFSADGKNAEVLLKKEISVRETSPVVPIAWKPEWVFAIADRFSEGMPLHKKTWATHSCFLVREDQILFECEDIGRHNAFDKVIGYALKNEIDLTKCMVYSSGRIPADMTKKAIMSRVPILAAKAVPTLETLKLAEDYHLTVIGAARKDCMKVYLDFAEEQL